MHSIELNHFQNPSEYWSGRYDFFRRFIPATQNAPWPYNPPTQGYFIDAGEDRSAIIGETISLSGSIFYNEFSNPSFPLSWSLIDGPCNADFSNAQSYNPTVSFDQPGEYTIQLLAHDYQKLNNEQQYYSLVDYITISVEGPGNPTVLCLKNCPSDITITAEEGTIASIVSWTEPDASTNCNPATTNIQQIEGLPNGAFFEVGTHSISYQTTDECDNIESCSFTITLSLIHI